MNSHSSIPYDFFQAVKQETLPLLIHGGQVAQAGSQSSILLLDSLSSEVSLGPKQSQTGFFLRGWYKLWERERNFFPLRP